jgi:hypothetical protein
MNLFLHNIGDIDSDNLPDGQAGFISPAGFIENLEAGLESFREIMVKLNA